MGIDGARQRAMDQNSEQRSRPTGPQRVRTDTGLPPILSPSPSPSLLSQKTRPPPSTLHRLQLTLTLPNNSCTLPFSA
jgi:hypothetical protein